MKPEEINHKLGSLPQELFNPLAAPGRNQYLCVLLELFQLASQAHGLLDRDHLVAAAEELLADESVLAETDDLEDIELHYGSDETDDFVTRRRSRAQAMVRYLERCGWFRTEMQSNQTAQIVMYDYSFRLLDALHGYVGAEPTPLQGLICSIHDLVVAALGGDSVEVRITEAARQCEHLINALRELEHTIGLHMEKLLNESEVKDVMVRLLYDYGTEVIDSGYHKLKTTDHVSRYRPQLLEACEKLLGNFNQENADGKRDPKSEKLLYLMDSFESLDEKISRIDDRHRLFVDAAVRKVEKMMMGQSTVSGFAQTVLTAFISQAEEVSELVQNEVLQLVGRKYFDSRSLYSPRAEKQKFDAVQKPAKRISKAAIARANKETAAQLAKSLGKERIQVMAEMLLTGTDCVRASELNINSANKLALLMTLRAYGDGKLGYRTRDLSPRTWVRKGEIGFYDFFIESLSKTASQRSQRAVLGNQQMTEVSHEL